MLVEKKDKKACVRAGANSQKRCGWLYGSDDFARFGAVQQAKEMSSVADWRDFYKQRAQELPCP